MSVVLLSILASCNIFICGNALSTVLPDSGSAICPAGSVADTTLPSFSQLGEDKRAIHLIDALLDGKTGGTFLEVGAYNGLWMSNTKLLEYAFGYSGLLIEANPPVFKELRRYRGSRSVTLNMAVCEGEPRVLELSVGGCLGCSTIGGNQGNKVEINCDSLGSMAQQAGLGKGIDFMSIDVEGYEMPTLRSFNWSIPVNIAVVEATISDMDAVTSLLAEQGNLVKVVLPKGKDSKINVWFVHKRLVSRLHANFHCEELTSVQPQAGLVCDRLKEGTSHHRMYKIVGSSTTDVGRENTEFGAILKEEIPTVQCTSYFR